MGNDYMERMWDDFNEEEFMAGLWELKDEHVLGYFINTEPGADEVDRTPRHIFLEHLWAVWRLLEGLPIDGGGKLCCLDCFRKESGKEPGIENRIPMGNLKGNPQFKCSVCGCQL